MMDKGWKPMPVILKIIWILLIVEAFFAILTIASVYGNGFDFMGFSMYGMLALDIFFVAKIALPIVLIIGMHQRCGWIWIVALGYYLLFAVNGFVSIGNIAEIQNKMLEQMPEIPEGITEELYYQIIHWTIIFSLIMGSLFNVAIMILIFIKRKYFLVVKHLEPPSENELPE
jgi:hypothetical protein